MRAVRFSQLITVLISLGLLQGYFQAVDGNNKNNEDLSDWMTKLPGPVRDLPIINLAIPGSHDSMTYAINGNSKVAPDVDQIVGKVYKVVPRVIRQWSTTQKLSAYDQLKHGIRYLDLRICVNKKDKNKFYFAHGLYCGEITEPLKQIRQFMNDHPNEFIIFDCQHFYDFAEADYKRLEQTFKEIFNNKFYKPSDGHLQDLTLNKASHLKVQLFVIFRYSYVPKEFWNSDSWPTPWPEKFEVKQLEKYLDTDIKNRKPNTGHVTQCVLTPPVKLIATKFYSSLKSVCAEQVHKGLISWIKNQRPGRYPPNQPTRNVFIADFIDLNNYEFCRVVIGLNDKLVNHH